MKTAQLPPVRVAPAVREEIESALHEGESLSQFVEAAALQAARRRKAQKAFLARGRASIERAKATGDFHAMSAALDEMRSRLNQRIEAERRARSSETPRP